MKRFWNGKTRLLSLLLSLVLAVGLLMPTICIDAYAVSHGHITVNPTLGATDFYADGSLKSVQITVTFPSNSYGTAYGRIALHNGVPQHDSASRYTDTYNGWPTDYSRDSTFIAIDAEEEFQWTGNAPNKTWTRTLTFTQGQVSQGVYSLYMWTRCPTAGSSRGVYADAFLTYVTVGSNGSVSLGNQPGSTNPQPHTHHWTPVTTGNGTKAAATTISCSGCSETLSVSLTASDVTLPGSVFTAKISTEAASAARAAQSSLSVSQTPGYKYSASGSDFAPIDPNQFTPVPGFYQASILVTDGNDTVENLYVTYTASDPVVTAATGDNRPIERMVMGMAFFSALGIAAFFLDSKRKARR